MYFKVSTPAENKALVHRLLEIVNAGELGAIEEVASGEIAEAARRWIGPFGSLEIACVAERKSMTELLRPVVEEYAAELAKEPEIATMLDQARRYEARRKGVELLPEKAPTTQRRGSRRQSAGN